MLATRWLNLALVAAVLAACSVSVSAPKAGSDALTRNARRPFATPKLTAVRGGVRVPSGYSALGGDPFARSNGLIAAGSMNLIAAGSMNLIAAGSMNYRLSQQVSASGTLQPLVGSEVYLADGTGAALPEIPPVFTDEAGEYLFADIPDGFTYVVLAMARTPAGLPVNLKTIVQARDGRADVDPATTLATEAVVDTREEGLGQFNTERFQQLQVTIREDLTRNGVPDLANPQAVASRIVAIQEAAPTVRQVVETLREDLRDPGEAIAVLREQLAARPQPTAAPSSAPRRLTCEEAFAERDENGDDVVEAKEASGAAAFFAAYDQDKNGKVTREEACGLVVRRPVAASPAPEFIVVTATPASQPTPSPTPALKPTPTPTPTLKSTPTPTPALKATPTPTPVRLDSTSAVTTETALNSGSKLSPTQPVTEPATKELVGCDNSFKLAAGDNGQVDLKEFLQVPGATEEQFAAADLDKSGWLDRQEYGLAECGETRKVSGGVLTGAVDTLSQ
ncbi:MAG: hypothetical protein VKP62_15240 [Candidatus Sericytochromatia bacterium]|nr:hypothetical protein [Candidatus Sericytochromatia bacterium]